MLRKKLLIMALKRKNFLKFYELSKADDHRDLAEIKKRQEKELQDLIRFSYENVPYYTEVFKERGLKPYDIQTFDDLQKLPLLTKEIIRERADDLVPLNLESQDYGFLSTGGSTGVPLIYRISTEDEVIGTAMRYANWGYGGYVLGDKIMIIAGTSLIPQDKQTKKDQIKNRIRSFMMNEKSFPSSDLNDEYMKNIVVELNKTKPKFIRGFPSAIYFLARYIKEKNMTIRFHLDGVFTTAEVLLGHHRETIEDVFSCRVFDQYGLNDGGLSAYECEEHNGFHIDMLRSIMEVTDENGNQIGEDQEGKLLATSLHNYAMPFIRYDTGDMGIVSYRKCKCGRTLPLLEKLVGRDTDYLKFGNGAIMPGSAFVDFVSKRKYDIIQYQIIQKKPDEILIYIIKGKNYSDTDEKDIRDIFYKRAGKINIEFKYVDKIQTAKNGKWKFIIREC